eukprot:snap_masked-scaffold_72-processed-gene-0.40-mRNA-1 protein AED:0.09 eAED:0.09 QI:0/-1/0/1/-1/1/1/0/399
MNSEKPKNTDNLPKPTRKRKKRKKKNTFQNQNSSLFESQGTFNDSSKSHVSYVQQTTAATDNSFYLDATVTPSQRTVGKGPALVTQLTSPSNRTFGVVNRISGKSALVEKQTPFRSELSIKREEAFQQAVASPAFISNKRLQGENYDEIQFEFNVTFGIVNSLVATLLLVMSLFTLILVFVQDEDLLCVDGAPVDLPDVECAFKYLCFLCSTLLLLPYLAEAVQASRLFIGGSLQDVYKGRDLLNEVVKNSPLGNMAIFLRNLGYLIFAMIAAIPLLFTLPWSKQARDTWKAVPFVVPTLLLNLCLFPLSFVVIFTADNPAETMIDTMALQIYAGVSNVFVRQVFSPQNQLAATLSLFFPTFNFYNKDGKGDGTSNRTLQGKKVDSMEIARNQNKQMMV